MPAEAFSGGVCALSRANAISAFEACGIYPLNRQTLWTILSNKWDQAFSGHTHRYAFWGQVLVFDDVVKIFSNFYTDKDI